MTSLKTLFHGTVFAARQKWEASIADSYFMGDEEFQIMYRRFRHYGLDIAADGKFNL
jgi:hypothetical protein